MPIENASFISELVATNPPGNEPVGEGDNHLRLIKDVLKKTFTGGAGGLAGPVTVTHAELNRLAGINSNIQSSITALNSLTAAHSTAISNIIVDTAYLSVNLSAPPETEMLFYQNAAPLGWSVQTADANRLVIVSNFGGGFQGGSDEVVSVNLDHTHSTGDFTLTTTHMPAHQHLAYYKAETEMAGGGGRTILSVSTEAGSTGSAFTSSVGSSSAHNHGVTGSSLSDWEPRYSVYIRCRKI